MRKLLGSATFYRKVLLVYWIITLIAMVLYAYATVMRVGGSFREVMTTNASFAIFCLLGLFTFMDLLLFFRLDMANAKPTEESDHFFVVCGLAIQQACMLNFPGAILTGLYAVFSKDKQSISWKKVSVAARVVLMILLLTSLLALALYLRVSNLH